MDHFAGCSQAHEYFEDPVSIPPVRGREFARTLVHTHKRVANLKKYLVTDGSQSNLLHNRLVGGSSPAGPTTHSRSNGDFPEPGD